MKYYFVLDNLGKRHIVVVENEEELKDLLKDADLVSDNFYELKSDTFECHGFLISDK
jgi:hypothetical protein